MPGVLQSLRLIRRFKDLQKITSGTWDGQKVNVLNYDVDLHADHLHLECTFTAGNEQHSITAKHPWREDTEETVIQIDGSDVEQDDVDLDFDTFPLRNKIVLEYRLEYIQGGTNHDLTLRASSNLR